MSHISNSQVTNCIFYINNFYKQLIIEVKFMWYYRVTKNELIKQLLKATLIGDLVIIFPYRNDAHVVIYLKEPYNKNSF